MARDLEQEIWSNCVNYKLYAIYQTVGSAVHNKGLSRHESVIINRLQIGRPYCQDRCTTASG